MRVRQCRLSGRRVPGSGFWCVAIGLEPILRFSISIMPALLAMPVDALLYPSNPQAGIELHHNGQSTEHFAPTPCCCVGWVMSPSRQCSFLLCRNEKAQGVNLGLEFFVCRQSKLWRRYQIYMKYMPFSSVLQDLHLNLSPFVVNVIALLR